VAPFDQVLGFEGTHYVALDEEIMQEKIRLVNMHESQVGVFKQMGDDFGKRIYEEAKRIGACVGAPYAEVFRPCLAARRVPLANMLP
jgi:hypothetical protein